MSTLGGKQTVSQPQQIPEWVLLAGIPHTISILRTRCKTFFVVGFSIDCGFMLKTQRGREQEIPGGVVGNFSQVSVICPHA